MSGAPTAHKIRPELQVCVLRGRPARQWFEARVKVSMCAFVYKPLVVKTVIFTKNACPRPWGTVKHGQLYNASKLKSKIAHVMVTYSPQGVHFQKKMVTDIG